MGRLPKWTPAVYGAAQMTQKGSSPDVDQEFDEAGRGYWNCPGMNTQGSSNDSDRHLHEERNPSTKDTANLVSSLCKDGWHRPVLDFDFPVRYVASSTPGHGHLYIDRPLLWEQYEKLLQVMEEVGILETGYVNAAIHRNATFVRPEWIKKVGIQEPLTPPDRPVNSKNFEEMLAEAEAGV